MKYRVERERWVSTEENAGIMRGYDEVYYDEVEADYFGVDEHGTVVFYRKETTDVGVGYTIAEIAAYASGEWRVVKETVNESSVS